ncbi:hypothetical protein [Frankia sp. Cr2]|uniref:hypothetical protein n=1 Tax=Frankia sp. Cr2 TaxID=3073932 RepID=UPI002AD351E5|nr:hypothetical protein [Frankia sp. Cr2]
MLEADKQPVIDLACELRTRRDACGEVPERVLVAEPACPPAVAVDGFDEQPLLTRIHDCGEVAAVPYVHRVGGHDGSGLCLDRVAGLCRQVIPLHRKGRLHYVGIRLSLFSSPSLPLAEQLSGSHLALVCHSSWSTRYPACWIIAIVGARLAVVVLLTVDRPVAVHLRGAPLRLALTGTLDHTEALNATESAHPQERAPWSR